MATDLHLHSTASDGTLSPRQVVLRASELGLLSLALCDHDTVAGVSEALATGRESGVEIFPGVEISALWGRQEIHILGYLIDWKNAQFCAILNKIQTARWTRAQEIVRRLNVAGIAIKMEDVAAKAAGESVGRPHVAAVLVAMGMATSVEEAFRRYLRPGRRGYVERERPDAVSAVRLIHEAGGVAVLAHPVLYGGQRFLRELQELGIEGVEAYHIEHTEKETQQYIQLATQLGLFITGGSDSHGPQGPAPVEIGAVNVPDSCAEALRQWGREHGKWPLQES